MILSQAKRSRQPIPEWLLNKPELPQRLVFYWNAFWDLRTCRPVGTDAMLGEIPWTAVNQYSQRYKLSDEQDDALHLLVTALDYYDRTGKDNDTDAA